MSASRLLLVMIVGVVAAGGAAYVLAQRVAHARSTEAGRGAAAAIQRDVVVQRMPPASTTEVPALSAGPAVATVVVPARSAVVDSGSPEPRATYRVPGARGVTLPPSLLELVRTTRWDEEASAVLDRFVAATFDANGDGTIDDIERIHAVRALRDAVWDDALVDADDSHAESPDESPADTAPATLSDEDRRLHHDVDQARRLDREDLGGGTVVDAAVRSAVLDRFAVDDDGRVTTAELARYLSARRAGLPSADLNGDGTVDDVDLRLYLDVASPIARD